MDLRAYYRKIRDLEATLDEKDVVVVSLATPDGGQEGIQTEVARRVGCQLVVEGKARLATTEESASYRESVKQAQQEAELNAEGRRLQVSVLSEQDLRSLRLAMKSWKGTTPEAS